MLDTLAVQLQSENPKPLKVRKSKTKREPHFKVGDVLAVKFENEYGAIFVSDVDQSPRKSSTIGLYAAFTKRKTYNGAVFK